MARRRLLRRAGAAHWTGAGSRTSQCTTYKSAELFHARHGRKADRKGDAPWESEEGRFDIAGYLDYQGKLFWERFDANAYLTITRAMDLFDPQRDWNGEAWERVRAKVLLFGISSDVLFPESDVRKLAEEMRAAGVDCTYECIDSSHGHDSFLAEPDKLAGILREFVEADVSAPDSLRAVGVGEQGGDIA